MRARRPILALGLLVALVLSACGSGSKSSTGTSPGGSSSTPTGASTGTPGRPSSKAAVIAQADAICRAHAGIGKIAKAKSTKQLVATLTTVEAGFQDTGRGLAALAPPATIKRSFDAYRAALAQAAKAVQVMLEAAKASNAARFNNARLALDTFTIEAQDAAGKVGFQACGVGG